MSLVLPVQRANSKLESNHLLREKLEKFIALRITTGRYKFKMRIINKK